MGNIINKVLGIDAGAATKPLTDFKPTNFSAGGISTDISDGRVSVTADAGRTGAVTDISQGYKNLAGSLTPLVNQVTPGAGRLSDAIRASTQAERERLGSTRQRVVGNLRENLAKRRVAGSSFAVDSLARAESEFARQERELGLGEQEKLANTFLQELDLKTQLIQKQASANIQSFTTLLDSMNLEAEIGTQLASGATAAFQANASLEAQLLAEAQGTTAEILGAIGGAAAGGAAAGAASK